MSVRKDTAQVTVIVDGKQGINELGRLENEVLDAKRAMEGLTRGTKAYKAAMNRLRGAEARMDSLRKKMGLAGMTTQQLRNYQRQLRRDLETTTTSGTQRYAQLKQQLIEVNQQLAIQRAGVRASGRAYQGMRGPMMGALGGMTLSIAGVVAASRRWVMENAALSDVLGDVRKTTGLTEAEVAQLDMVLSRMDTRTAQQELLRMAKVAGKLGVTGKRDIEGFVRAADKINIAMGEDLGDVEEATRQLGKLTESFKLVGKYGIEDALLKVGSAINHLGKSSTANEGFILDFSKRMAGIAPVAKISVQEVLAMGATMDALGQTSEVSSSAMSKLLQAMVKNKETFARMAGVELPEFQKAMEENAMEALLLVLEAAGKTEGGITTLVDQLGDMGAEGVRTTQVFGVLSQNVDLYRKQLEISRVEFERGTSVLNEYNLKNQTLAANLDKIGKAMKRGFVNSGFVQFLSDVSGEMAEWVRNTHEASDSMERERFELVRVRMELEDVNVSQERKNTLVAMLQERYPDYISAIGDEAEGYGSVIKQIDQLNEAMIRNIALKIKEEDITEAFTKAAKNEVDAAEEQLKIRKRLAVFTREGLNAEGQALLEEYERTQERMRIDKDLFESNPKLLKLYEDSLRELIEDINDVRSDMLKELGGGGLGIVEDVKALHFLDGETMEEQVESLDGYLSNDAIDRLFGKTERITLLKNQAADARSEASQMQEELRLLQEQLGAMVNPFAGGGGDDDDEDGGGGGSAPTGPSEEELKKIKEAAEKRKDALEKILQGLKSSREKIDNYDLDARQQEATAIDQHYERLQQQAKDFLDEGIITKQDYQLLEKEIDALHHEEMNRLTDDWNEEDTEKRKEILRAIQEETLSDMELELLEAEEHYNALLAEAAAYGLDTVALVEAMEAAKAAIRERYAKEEQEKQESEHEEQLEARREQIGAMVSLAQGAGAVLGGIMELVGDNQEKMSGFHKALVAGQLLANTAAAIGNVVQQATGLKNPLAIAGVIAAGVGQVLSQIATAKRMLSQAKTPSRPELEKELPGYFGGGPTKGIGLKDNKGLEIAGVVHADEYVIPAALRQDAQVIQMEQIIEQKRTASVSGTGSSVALSERGDAGAGVASYAGGTAMSMEPATGPQQRVVLAVFDRKGLQDGLEEIDYYDAIRKRTTV